MNFEDMRRPVILAVLAVLSAVSCGPSSYTMSVDVRRPSATGYDFSGKSMAIAYLVDGKQSDSTFIAAMAEGLASGLEKDYFNSETVIPLYTLPYVPDSDYSAKDTLVNLIMDLESDVVLLLDRPVFKESVFADKPVSGYNPQIPDNPQTPDGPQTSNSLVTNATVPFYVNLYVMDAMDKADTVRVFRGISQYPVAFWANGNESREELEDLAHVAAASMAQSGGASMAGRFAPEWEKLNCTFYYYSDYAWVQASEKLVNCDFKGAMDGYLELVGRGSADRRASAAYDLALCCYLIKEYEMAIAWLDYADRCYQLPNSQALRKRCLQK